MSKAKVYVKFPRAGLGNMLLTWSRGFVFAHLNGLTMVTSGWLGFRLGPWIRREKKKRLYWGFFREESWLERKKTNWQKIFRKVVHEPEVEINKRAEDRGVLFQFDQVSPSQDLFGHMRSHRLLVRQGIVDMLLPEMKRRLAEYTPPAIAIHVRRGDFKIASPITPLEFFINAIKIVRSETGTQWPVTVFTDAAPEEIKDILDLPDVSLTEDKPDILDILLMSKSKVLVLSRSSTFSYWGAFLSDAIIIKPEGDWQGDLRPPEVNKDVFEGKVDFNDRSSVKNLEQELKKYR
ncbi:MAG TPA: alpha-1,2-fucosyltransferase [Puia sp.]|jgi:hypothetical protein